MHGWRRKKRGLTNVFARGFKAWCENVAIQQRRELGLRPTDPLDPWQLAKHLGIRVHTPSEIPGLDPDCLKTLLQEDADSWSAVTISAGSQDVIILNSSHKGGRPASDLTHELAHILLGHEPARIDVTADGTLMLSTYDKKQEEEANWLAGCLLLPRDALIVIQSQGVDSKLAARRYGISQQMLQFRRNVTGVDYQLARARGRNTA